MSKNEIVNREHWLQNCAEAIAPRIAEVTGDLIPNFRISCGWPSSRGLSVKRRVIGQCWDGFVSSDNRAEMFISPMLADPMEVAATVAHELTHAAVGCKHGHKKPFIRVVRAIGLEGKPTATYAGEVFKAIANPILEKLGDYPHAHLVPNANRKVQPTALLKVYCVKCGMPIRMTRKWIESTGTPICPCNGIPMVVEGEEDECDN